MAAAKKSKKKISVQSMIVQPYGFELIVSNDWDNLITSLKTKYGYQWTHDVDMKEARGISFTVPCASGEVKFVQFAEDDITMVHESIHTAWHILDHAGIELTVDNHEALAYTVEWIVNECRKWLT